MHLMGLLAGKWPHSLAIQPGGTTRSIEIQEQMRIGSILIGLRRFLESVLFGDALEVSTGRYCSNRCLMASRSSSNSCSESVIFF